LSLEGSGTEARDAPTPHFINEGGMLYDIEVLYVVVKVAQGTSLFEVCKLKAVLEKISWSLLTSVFNLIN
jgi:hypothetical protein